MNSVAEDIKDILEDDSVGVFGTDIFIGIMPELPDSCICLSDNQGLGKPESRYEWDYTGVQVLIRGAEGGYQAVYAKAVAVKVSLHGLVNETVNSAIYKMIQAGHDPLYLGVDNKNRPMFSINFEIQRTSA